MNDNCISIKEGDIIQGIVESVSDLGMWIDLDDHRALLHHSDISWGNSKDLQFGFNSGDHIFVKVLTIDNERNRITVGIKQITDDPWNLADKKYPAQTKVTAKITEVTDYGCFAEIDGGLTGLIHISELKWSDENIRPCSIYKYGDTVEVIVIDMDIEKRRLSLSIKQCLPNPWEELAIKFKEGDIISGIIKKITDMWLVVELEGGIEGLMISKDDLSIYTVGNSIDTVLLTIVPECKRISLGVK